MSQLVKNKSIIIFQCTSSRVKLIQGKLAFGKEKCSKEHLFCALTLRMIHPGSEVHDLRSHNVP